MRFKVGDRVRIKSLDWYNENKNKFGKVWTSGKGAQIPFDKHMSKWCGKVMTISDVRADHYTMIEDLVGYWTDEMIEGLVEEENNDCEKCGLIHNSTRCLFMDNCPHNKQKNIIEIPDDYIFKDENGNVINATKIVLEKKKPKYPKTYEECCNVLGYSGNYNMILTTDVDNELFNALYRLKVCRDAYWKIAGEEMGLGKPWEPDWNDENQVKYIIGSWLGTIQCLEENYVSHPFAFPTEEMQDAFYENFREEIEICKEFL